MGALAVPLALAGMGLVGAGVARRNQRSSAAAAANRMRTSQATSTAVGRTDNRKRTPNAQETGRTAIPRPAEGTNTAGTPTPPDTKKADGDAQLAARRMAMRTRRKGASQRPGTLLTGGVVGSAMTPRTLLGYS